MRVPRPPLDLVPGVHRVRAVGVVAGGLAPQENGRGGAARDDDARRNDFFEGGYVA
jgi:hypothetical protein